MHAKMKSADKADLTINSR